MKITALEPQRNNTERVNVYLDDAFAFGLAALEAIRLRVGQELSEADIVRLREADAYHKAHDRALTYLGRRPRSSSELRRYLLGKEIKPEIVEAVITRLSEAGLLSDEMFAQYWIENRERFRPKGDVVLRQELRLKGVDRDTIDAALTTIEGDEADRAYRAGHQKLSRFAGITDRQQFFQKVNGYLSRRGFGWEAVRAAADRLWQRAEAQRNGEPFDDDDAMLSSDW